MPVEESHLDQLWAFVSLDDSGHEALCGFPLESGGELVMPMIAGDEDRVASLIPIAEKMARASGLPIRLIKMSKREEVQVFWPPAS